MKTSSAANPPNERCEGRSYPTVPPESAAELRLPTAPARASRHNALWAALTLGAAAVVAKLAVAWNLPLFPCWLRKLTGIPCPSCGCTRSLLAWLDGDPGKAFRFNPLFFVCCVAVLLWLAIWVVEGVSGRRVLAGWRRPLSRPLVWKIGLALLALNWLYLCLTLPK